MSDSLSSKTVMEDVRELLEWMNRKGGMGLDVHDQINRVLKRVTDETPAPHAPGCASLACRDDGMQNWNRACDCGTVKTNEKST